MKKTLFFIFLIICCLVNCSGTVIQDNRYGDDVGVVPNASNLKEFFP